MTPTSRFLSVRNLVCFCGFVFGLGLAVPYLMFWSVHGLAEVRQSLRFGFGVGVRLLHYLDDWLVIGELRTLQHRILVLQLCRDMGIIVNWEKSDLQPSTCVRYLGDADRDVS